MLLLGFVLNLIKTLAINTNHGTLTDKGMWINLADKAENGWSLALLGKHEEHLHILTVLTQNLAPKILNAHINKVALAMKYGICTGQPVAQ